MPEKKDGAKVADGQQRIQFFSFEIWNHIEVYKDLH